MNNVTLMSILYTNMFPHKTISSSKTLLCIDNNLDHSFLIHFWHQINLNINGFMDLLYTYKSSVYVTCIYEAYIVPINQ